MKERLTEMQFLVLAVLCGEPRGLHGYGILGEVEALTGGKWTYALPSLYGGLRAMEESGFVKMDREVSEGGRLRRYYKVTSAGRKAVAEYWREAEEIRAAVARIAKEWT